ncbi:hypothetical protein LCGC14_2807400 [marine sediment metagenome]|uniref:Uncharacterized protein n=1 Tax=marine sediment metagenome TaxID=412755 RepID=A0A0F8YKV9_9ZZZZ
MPTTNAGIYEIILEQEYFTSQIRNVFHYLSTIDLDDVQELCAQAFDEDVLQAIANLAGVNMSYNLIRCKNLTGNLADAVLDPSISAGVSVGAVVADFVAVSFLYARLTKDTRNGAKRFSALTEDNIAGGGFSTAYQTVMDASATVFFTNIQTVGGIFQPIILRKPPDAMGVFTFNPLFAVQALNRVTTQNSRKTF